MQCWGARRRQGLLTTLLSGLSSSCLAWRRRAAQPDTRSHKRRPRATLCTMPFSIHAWRRTLCSNRPSQWHRTERTQYIFWWLSEKTPVFQLVNSLNSHYILFIRAYLANYYFLFSRRFGFRGPSSWSGGRFFNCFSHPQICFMNFELGEPAHRAINHRVALPGLDPRVFDPL